MTGLMQVRQFKDSDYQWVLELYRRQGFDYELPTMDAFKLVQVVVDDEDQPVMVLAARPTVEMFLIVDSAWETPQWRLEAFKLVHEAMRAALEAEGITDVHAWLPPEIEKSFARRLMRRFGWKQQLWNCYSRLTTPTGD